MAIIKNFILHEHIIIVCDYTVHISLNGKYGGFYMLKLNKKLSRNFKSTSKFR